MLIKKLYATFGRLDEAELSLAPGLNIVCGSNESGKSTWCAFIRAIFYGIATREKGSAKFIADKNRFKPWNGKAPYGKAEIVTDQGDAVIERTSKRNVFSSENSYITATGKELITGEALCGVPLEVYRRTAFIEQAGLRITRDNDLEKRILAAVSGGDELISAEKVKSDLIRRSHKLKYQGKGKIFELCAEEEKTQSLLSDMAENERARAEAQKSAESAEEEISVLSRKLKIAKAEERKARREYIKNAENALREAQETAARFEKYPTRDILDDFSAKKEDFRALDLEAQKLELERASAEEKLSAVSAKLSESPFGGCDAGAAKAAAEEDLAVISAPEKKKTPWASFIPAFAAILCAVFAFVFKEALFVPLISASGAAFILAAVLFFVLRSKTLPNPARDEIAQKYGEASESAVNGALSEYLPLLSQKEELSSLLSHKKEELSAKCAEAELRKRDIFEILRRANIETETASEGEKVLRSLVREREDAFAAANAAKIKAEAASRAAEADEDPIEYSDSEIPEESADKLSSLLTSKKAAREHFALCAAELSGKFSGIDRDEVSRRLLKITEEKDALSLQFDALCLAAEKIDESDKELKARFSPDVSRRTAEIFKALTGGEFNIVNVTDNDFHMNVAANNSSEPHDMLLLSQGTLDELYLALRLALAETVLTENPPLILDDALVNFDNERMERTLRYLKELAKTRQVILFSCHTREAEYFKGDADVNITKI